MNFKDPKIDPIDLVLFRFLKTREELSDEDRIRLHNAEKMQVGYRLTPNDVPLLETIIRAMTLVQPDDELIAFLTAKKATLAPGEFFYHPTDRGTYLVREGDKKLFQYLPPFHTMLDAA